MVDISAELRTFLSDVESQPVSTSDKRGTYTNSGDYLIYTTSFHHDHAVSELVTGLKPPAGTTIIDVGCCSGFTGLTFALQGYKVAFHDFEGLGLQFVRWFGDKHALDIEVIPYGGEIEKRYDIAIALDVMEHTGNHLGFIRWISDLAHRVIICYPLMAFGPPYSDDLDEWVDDQVIRNVVEARYKLQDDYLSTSADRRFLIWKV